MNLFIVTTHACDGRDENKEAKVLNPATEDPVARRAVRKLYHKACPDTKLSADELMEIISRTTELDKARAEIKSHKSSNSKDEGIQTRYISKTPRQKPLFNFKIVQTSRLRAPECR